MYSPFRHIDSIFRKDKIIQLTFFLTKRCNLRCPFCFYVNSKKINSSDELSLDEIERFSRSMGNLLWLAFSGGEIYLRDDLVEISRIFYRNNRPAIMLFPTNGMLPTLIRETTEEILRECKESIIVVKLSLDGLKERHDELRGRSGCFDNVITTYRLLEGLIAEYPNFELGVNTVFCSKNQDEMDEIIDFVNSLKNVKTHTISLVRGDIDNESYKDVDYEKYRREIKKLEMNLKNKTSNKYRFRGARLKAAQDILQRRLIYKTATEKRRFIPCYAGRLNIVLTEKGDIYPCEIIGESLGNIKEYGYNIDDLIRSDRAKRVIKSIKNNGCYCTHECYFMTNILFNPLLYPALFKEYIGLIFSHLND
jgi:radical SAM protein with 4Fe4S-binding SPASM domain